jgi:hypothetical protein
MPPMRLKKITIKNNESVAAENTVNRKTGYYC